MVNVNLEFGYLDQNAEITKEDEKKKNILHLDILKWYNVFQLCQIFCMKELYIYCKNAFDDSFMMLYATEPKMNWCVEMSKTQNCITHNSWNPV